jgi:hypothetical protein
MSRKHRQNLVMRVGKSHFQLVFLTLKEAPKGKVVLRQSSRKNKLLYGTTADIYEQAK